MHGILSFSKISLSLFLSFGFLVIQASDLVEVLPLHRNILMLHFNDGYVRHHLLGEARDNEWVIASPLDLSIAGQANAYLLTSPDDTQYQGGLSPLQVGRKSKATDFTWLCQGWNGNCVNTDPDHAKEHWLYLELPFALQNGKTYQLSFPGFATLDSVVLVYDDRVSRSEAVHVNQLGYVPSATEKYGYVYHWGGDLGGLNWAGFVNNSFDVVDTLTGMSVFSGNLAFRKAADNQEFGQIQQAPPYGNLVGAEVYECDFSALTIPGTYRLCVDGIGCSFAFELHDSIYQAPLAAIVNGLYQQRSGIATMAPYTDQPRPAPHNPNLTPGFAGKLLYSTFRYPDFSENDNDTVDKAAIDAAVLGPLNVWGWYQDAGDWDSYYSHTEVPLSLLWLYEIGASKFADQQFMIPESGNAFPDLLDEAMWLPRFHYRLRQSLMTQNYGSGGVGGGRIFGDLWGEDVLADGTTIGSWQDTVRTWVCTGEDPFMTYKYSALAAHIAYLLAQNNLTDPDNIDWYQEALEAYNWASNHTLPQDTSLFSYRMTHTRMLAAANLYRLTGDNAYQMQLMADWNQIPNDVIVDEELLFAMATYLATEGIQSLEPNTFNAISNKMEAEADFIMLDFRDNRACRWAGNWYFPFLVGQPTTPLVQAGVMGHYLFKDKNPQKAEQYKAALYSTADYFLGNNPLNMCWITRMGERSPKEILNLDSWYLGGDVPRSGIVPYGPWQAESDFGPLGPWNHMWALEFIYPTNKSDWPAHERFFDQRTAAFTNEYTVAQNLAPAIFTYGYLYSLTAPKVSTAIESEAYQLAFKVYPNPTSSQIHITTDNPQLIEEIILFDLQGKVIERSAQQALSLNIQTLSPGLYQVCVRAKGGQQGCQKVLLRP